LNWPKLVIAALGILIVGRGLTSMLLFTCIFKRVFDQKLPAFRAEGDERWGVMLIGYASWSLVFSYLFGVVHPSGGIVHGLGFGALVWAIYFLPMVTAVYATFGVTRKWALAAVVIGAGESLVGGAVAGVVYAWGAHAS
jgi:hypothetical protein